MLLSKNLPPVVETLLKLPHAKIAKIISLFLLIYIAYLLAKITWIFLDETPQNNYGLTNNVSLPSKKVSKNYNLNGIAGLNLFGVYSEFVTSDNEPEEVEAVPETTLKLTLTGVVASNEDSQSAAIIENNGTQEVYAIEDIINGTRAVLKKVHNDRVLIRHSGRLETLMLDGFDYTESMNKPISTSTKSSQTNSPQKQDNQTLRVDQRGNFALTKQAQALRNDINEDPGKITDYLKISPQRENGKIIGYRLMPGKKPEFFKSSGLKSGDVAIQMNGYELSEPVQAAQALKALKEEQEVSLLVDRNSDITEILFSINK